MSVLLKLSLATIVFTQCWLTKLETGVRYGCHMIVISWRLKNKKNQGLYMHERPVPLHWDVSKSCNLL